MSYSPVYSQGFLYYTAGTPNTQFEVPQGWTAVVREFDAYDEIGDVAAIMGVALAAGAPFVNIAVLVIAPALTSGHWEGRVVVTEGGIIGLDIVALSTNGTAYVGGYLLRNTIS